MQVTLLAVLEEVARHDQHLSNGYAIRPLDESDLDGLAELYFQAYSPEIVRTLAEATDEIQQTFAGEYGALVPELSPVITNNGIIVGTVMTVAHAPWPNTPPGLFVIEVITHPGHRR